MNPPDNFDLTNLTNYRDRTLRWEDRRVAIKNLCLTGITIALAVTGGIGAVETPKIIRELRRFGAQVRVYATSHALKFITPLSLEWASGGPVITSLTATAEQVLSEDILLVCPATANMIAKAAVGIADDTVSTLIAGALGKRKYILDNRPGTIPPTLLMTPAMHTFLAAHPLSADHSRVLKENGFTFIDPRRDQGEEDKLKMPSPETIAFSISHAFYQNYYHHLDGATGKGTEKTFDPRKDELLITAGATMEPLDGVRLLTNRGTGNTGLVLANHLHALGVRVRLLISESRKKDIPPHLPQVQFFDSYDSYRDRVLKALEEGSISWGIFTAAVSDFKTDSFQDKKMDSGRPLTLTLISQPKVIQQVRESFPQLGMMVFKYTVDKSVEEITAVVKKMDGYDFVIANRKEDLTATHRTRYLFGGGGGPQVSQNDEELAGQIAGVILGSK